MVLLPLLLLLFVLELLPKENVVVFCCGGFWFAPKVNMLLVLLVAVVTLEVPKVGAGVAGVPKAEA